jgi:hypothetical protein
MTEIIRKPRRLYPIPDNIRELDKPWADVIAKRHHRVAIDREGYDKNDPENNNPLVVPPGGIDSEILEKM